MISCLFEPSQQQQGNSGLMPLEPNLALLSYEELLHPISEYVNGSRNSRIFDFAIDFLKAVMRIFLLFSYLSEKKGKLHKCKQTICVS